MEGIVLRLRFIDPVRRIFYLDEIITETIKYIIDRRIIGIYIT
jgi:hypothetical protein